MQPQYVFLEQANKRRHANPDPANASELQAARPFCP
jgi:hypothetical protein